LAEWVVLGGGIVRAMVKHPVGRARFVVRFMKHIALVFTLGLAAASFAVAQGAEAPPAAAKPDAQPAAGLPAPTLADVAYGSHPRQVMDFGVKLKEHCAAKGVPCELVYPGAPDVRHPTATGYLIATLKAAAP
jgi:hypothetical protein